MSNICVALRRPLREPHPEEATALAAKADLPSTGVAVDEYARLTNKNEVSKLYEASPWAAEIVRPAPVQSADDVPPKSLPRDMAFAKLQSRIFGSSGGGLDRHLNSSNGPTLYGEAMDGGIHSPIGLRSEETRAGSAIAATVPTYAPPHCVGRSAREVG